MFDTKRFAAIKNAYAEILSNYKSEILDRNITELRLKSLFQEIELLWYRHKEYIEFSLRNITKADNVSFLAGAVYLDIKNDGHKEFSLLGKYRVINDPLKKMSIFFEANNLPINYERIKNYIYDVGEDLFSFFALDCKYSFVFPLTPILRNDEKERNREIHLLAQKMILSLFNESHDNLENIAKEEISFEDIESKLDKQVMDQLVYLSLKDKDFSLRERIENYYNDTIDYATLRQNKTEFDIFLLITSQFLMQAIDIIDLAYMYNMIPFIRNEVVLSYVTLLVANLDDSLDFESLNKTFIAYVIQSAFDFSDIDYLDLLCTEGNGVLIDIIYDRLKAEEKLFPSFSFEIIAQIAEERLAKIRGDSIPH